MANVYYCEGLITNFISMFRLLDHGYKVSLDEGSFKAHKQGSLVMSGRYRDKLLSIDVEPRKKFASCSVQQWARRMGGLSRLAKQVRKGLVGADLTQHTEADCECRLIDP